jgi:hypothetical protein
VGVRPVELVSFGLQILTPKRVSHAGRLATMANIAASVAHEINQLIGAARNNAHAALGFFARERPDLAEASEALDRVISRTYRAGEILADREQIKKAPPRQECLDLSEAIVEVIKLVRGELFEATRISAEARVATASDRSSSTAAGCAESDRERDRPRPAPMTAALANRWSARNRARRRACSSR